jgi:predicted aldo/keto reductase-like oxidoreductase
MVYREMGKTGEKVSALGFGCMRLPTLDNGIDIPQATRMLRHAIDNGVDYVDTAWGYHNGQSEPFVGEALKEGYREKVNLATKLPSWLIKSREDMDHYLDEQLKRLQTDVIDFYLLDALNKRFCDNLVKNNVFDFMDRAKSSGRIKHIGFSFHDTLETFKKIVDAYDWEFCQIQYNFLDTDYQAGTEGLNYAYKREMGVIVMEPLRGGKLVRRVPGDVQKIWDLAPQKRSAVEWALRWVWNNPAVGVVLSGMSSMEQVEQNLEIADAALPNSLTSQELSLIARVREIYISRIKINCTACGYCMPCPNNVAIPDSFEVYNDAAMFDDVEGARRAYNNFFKPENRASKCIECGRCEELCPQKIPIIEKLKEVAALLE